MGRTSDLSPAERRDIVLMMLRREEPITTLSRRYGVSENTLHRWRDDFFNGGGHVPFGGHKGYALMLAAEFLGRILTGADAYVQPGRAGPVLRHQGVTMIAFGADLFQPFAEYASCADQMERRVRAVPPAPGFKEVLVPGDPEVRTRASRTRDGIPIEDDVWQSIVETAASLGIDDL